MDYHSLPRKQLQALCKKHDIPANQTNVQMADALTTLLKAEGKPKSDANGGRMQSVRVESGKENSNVPKASTRSNKEPVKSAEEGGCDEHVASVEDVESNEGFKVGKTRGRGLPKLVPESKEPKDEIDGTIRKHCRGSQREKTCKNSDSDFSTVDVTSKKMDKKKTSASEDEAVGEKAMEKIEGRHSSKVEETLKDQENHGKHLRHPRKKTMPEEQTKPKLIDVGTKRSRAGKTTHHPDVATELSVKDVDGEKETVTNKVPVIIDIVDSDDEEVVNGVKDKADIVNVSVEPTVNLSESLKPVVTVNASKSPKRVVARKGHKGGHNEEMFKTSSEDVKVNAVCISVEPASNSSECLKKAATLRGRKEKEVTASFEEGKIDTVHVSVKQRGQKGGKKEKLIITNSIEEAKNIVTDVPVEAIVNDSGSPKRVITRKGCKAEHKKDVLQTSSEEDKVDAVFVSAEPTSSSLKCLKQIVTRRGQKFSHKEEMLTNASSEEDKIDVVNVSDEPALYQRGRKGGKKGELIVNNSVEEAKNIVTDVPVEATVNASESPKGVVTRKGRKGEQKKEVLKVGSEEDKFNAVSVEPTSTSLECLKQVVTRRGQKCSHKEEKLMNASSEEDKIDVVNVPDEPAVNQRGRKGGKKGEQIVTNSIEEAKNIVTDVPVEATVNAFESPKGVVTRKGRKGEHKGDLKTGSEEDKFNAVCVSDEPTSTSLECLKQVVTRRGQKSSHKEEKVVNASSDEDKVDVLDVRTVNRRGRHGGQKKDSVVTTSSQEVKNIGTHHVPVEVTVNVSKSTKRVVTRKGCKGEHKKGEVLKANVEPTLNSSESLKQVVTPMGVKCNELLVNDSIKESKNDTTDISVEDNVSASESPERLVTRQGCKVVHEKVLDATAEESKANPVSIPVKPTVNCSENPKHVVTRRGIINKQEGRKVVTVISPECLKSVLAPGGGKSSNCEEEDLNDVKEKELCLIQDVEISEKTASHGDSASDQGGDFDVDNLNESFESIEEKTNQPHGDSTHEQEDGDFENKPDKVDASSNLVAKDEALEEKTMAGSTVFIDNILDQSLESLEKDRDLPCEGGLESAVNEEDARELSDSSSCEEDNFNDVTEKEICLIQDLEIPQQRAANGDSFNDQEDGDFEKKSEKVYSCLDSAANDDDALEEQTAAGDGIIDGSTVFVDNILDKSVESLEKDSNLPCEVDIDSTVNEEGAHELKDSRTCEEEDLNDVKEKELCLIQVVEISQQKASHGYSISDQEDGDFNVDNLNEALESIEEKTNQPHGDSANDQEDADFEKKPDNVYTCSDLAAKDGKALEEQTMAGSIVFIDNMLDESLEPAEKDSNLPCEACLDSAINEEESRESSSSEEDNFNDQEDGDFEEISEKVYTSLDLAEKDDDALEEETMAGDGMIAGSTIYVDNIWDKSLESLEKDSNLPCEVDIDSAVYEEDAREVRDSCICGEENLNDVKEKELVELSEQKASHGGSSSDQEDGDFEKKSEKAYNSSSLTAKDDDTMEEQTMVGDAMITGITNFVDNILDNSVEFQEKYSNLPCEVGIVSAVSEENAPELRDSSSCEEGKFNYVQDKELYLLQDQEMSQQKVSYDDSASVQENGDFEMKSEKFHTSSDLAAKDDEALEEKTMAGKGMIAGSTVFVDNMLAKSVESQDKNSNLQREAGMDVSVNEEDVHESRNSSSSEEDNFNDVKEKEVNLIEGLDITYDEDEDFGECHSGEVSVGNDSPQNLLSYVIEEASLSGTPLKKLERAVSSNISYFSGINDSAVEERQETLPTDCQSDASMKISGLIERHKELCSPTKKTEFTSSTTVSPWLGMDDFVTEESVELPELDNLQEMPEFTKGQLSPHLNSLFEEDTLLKKSELTGSIDITPCSGMDNSASEWRQEDCMKEDCNLGVPETDSPSKTLDITPCSGMDNSASEWSQEDCMKEDCNLGVPETDSPSTTLVLEKGHKESLFLDTLLGEGSPLEKCELIHSNAVPHSDMVDSAIKQSEVRPSTEAGKTELSEFDAQSKIFDCTEDNVFSFSPRLNIFDTPLKSPVPQSITGMPISSGMDDSTSEWSQEDCMKEDCNLGVPETDRPSKTLVLEKRPKESLFLDTLFGEGSPVEKCELIHSNVVRHSGMDDSPIKQSEVRPLTEAGKIELSEFDAQSKIFDCTEENDFSFSPCLNIFETPLKNPVLQSITGMPISSGMDDFAIEHNQGSHSPEACMKEDCNLGVPEIDSPSNILVLEKCRNECLFLDTLFGEVTPLKKCMDDSAIEQSEVNPWTGACKMELSEFDAPSKISDGTKDDDFSFSPCLNIFDTPLKDPALQSITPVLQSTTGMPICSGEGDSDVEQSSKILTKEASKLNNHDLQASSEIPEHINDQDISPCLNTLSVKDIGSSLKNCEVKRSSDISAYSGVVDSVTHKVLEVLPTEASKNEFSQIDDSSVEKTGDRSPFLNTLFVDKIVSTLKNFEHTSSAGVSPCGLDDSDVLPAEACKLGISELNTPSEISELSTEKLSCLKDLSLEITDTSLKTPMFTRGIHDSASDQSGDVLSKMAENTEDHDRSPCLETLFEDDKPFLSGIYNYTADQTVDVLRTEACKQELSQLDASSEMSEVTKDQDRSPSSNTVFLEGIDNLSKNIELTSSTRVKCSSVMNDSVLEQNQVVLPLEGCKQECYKFETPLKLSELTKDHSLSPCLNMDSTTVLEMSKACGTDRSVCSGGTDSGLPEMLEIHRTEDSKLQMALVRQSSSTSSERSKLADIDDLFQCADIDNYAPEEDSEILSIEASKLQCCQLDYQLKMVEPTEGHDLTVESDLTKLSLRQLRRLFKEEQMKQKKSGKVIRKHPALQDLSSNVLGEESSSFRKPKESQQDYEIDLQCNNESEVNTTLNEPELAEASEKLDKPEDFHQKSPAEIRLPQMTSSYRASSGDHGFPCESPAAGAIISENVFGESPADCGFPCVSLAAGAIISENVFGESPADCRIDLHCNNDVSQVNITSKVPELAVGSEKLDKPEEFSTGSDYVLHQTSPAEIRLPEMTSSYRVSPGSGIDDSIPCKTDLCFNNQPSEVNSPLSKPDLAEACNKPDKLDENSTSLEKSEDTGDHDLLCESPASRIITSETVLADEKNGLAFEEKPFVPNNFVESGMFFEEQTVCKAESRIPRLVDRLKTLNDRLQTMQSNLQGLAPELSYATPLRKGMHCRTIGSAKKNRVPMSVGRSCLASTKENPTDKTPLSLKRDQRSYKENQIKPKDSEKVVGKRPALKNLSVNVLEERDQTTLHIHEED